MQERFFHRHSFFLSLLGLCSLYLAMECWFNHYALVTVDELWYAHVSYQYKTGLPYRDFSPYKTVLGYYFLLLPLRFSSSVMQGLIFTKQLLACLNGVLMFAAALWLRRFFSSAAVVGSLALFIFSDTVLSYSTNIRVDLLAYWCCFFSWMLLLEKRYWLSGLLIGVGFLISQKVLWFVFASNGALLVYGLFQERRFNLLVKLFSFNAMALVVLAAYLVFWAKVAGFPTVFHNVFYEAAAMYHLDWYDSARWIFWRAIVLHNPLEFLLWPLTAVCLMVSPSPDSGYGRRLLIISYAFLVLFCLLPYKQVFPYYMQVTIPVFLVLYTAFLDWLIEIFKRPTALRLISGQTNLVCYLGMYLFFIGFMVSLLQLPKPYLLITLIPLLLGMYLLGVLEWRQRCATLCFALICTSMLLLGGVYSVLAYVPKLISFNGAYQKANLEAINFLLEDHSAYVAGIELIYNKTQPIAGMRHLMGPAIDYLYAPSEKLRSVMLASLYEDPQATADSVVADIEKSDVKFYVNNYRMEALPPKIKKYLASRYAHWWGSIYLYAPEIQKGQHPVAVKFSGVYSLESSSLNKIQINGKNYSAGTHLHLARGIYLSQAALPYRLKLIPPEPATSWNKDFQNDEWAKLIF